jgi:hypothetical protein
MDFSGDPLLGTAVSAPWRIDHYRRRGSRFSSISTVDRLDDSFPRQGLFYTAAIVLAESLAAIATSFDGPRSHRAVPHHCYDDCRWILEWPTQAARRRGLGMCAQYTRPPQVLLIQFGCGVWAESHCAADP